MGGLQDIITMDYRGTHERKIKNKKKITIAYAQNNKTST